LAVFFEQQHCSGCDEMHSIALQDKEIQELISKFQVARLNLHGQTPVVTTDGKKMTESEWARNLKVAFTPSIVFFDQHGKEVFRVEAYLKTFHLASSFDYVASGAYKTQPSFQRYVELRADELRNNGITVDLWK
jgi:thioredoxin-related protein